MGCTETQLPRHSPSQRATSHQEDPIRASVHAYAPMYVIHMLEVSLCKHVQAPLVHP